MGEQLAGGLAHDVVHDLAEQLASCGNRAGFVEQDGGRQRGFAFEAARWRLAYVRETQTGSGPKTEAGIRVVPLPPPAAEALRAWRKRQAAERLAWGPDWADNRGLVFTREDGTEVPGQWTSNRFEILAFRAGLVPVRFHDLRHGTASLMKAAKQDTKYISAMLGHSRTSFTDSQYVSLFPEIQKAAADAAAAMVPGSAPPRAAQGERGPIRNRARWPRIGHASRT